MNLFGSKDDQAGHTAGELGHTQYGTPLDQVLFLESNYDANKWIDIPSHWGADVMWKDHQEWAAANAPLAWGVWLEATAGAEHPGQDAVDRTALELASYGAKYGGFDPARPFQIVTYLYLPDPRQLAIAVRVWVDDRPDLTIEEAAGAQDPEAIGTPEIEKFHTEALGTGIKVTRHGTLTREDIPDGTGIFAATRYAFALPGRQAVVTVAAGSPDLAALAAAGPDLDEFVRTLIVTLGDGTPVPVGTAPEA